MNISRLASLVVVAAGLLSATNFAHAQVGRATGGGLIDPTARRRPYMDVLVENRTPDPIQIKLYAVGSRTYTLARMQPWQRLLFKVDAPRWRGEIVLTQSGGTGRGAFFTQHNFQGWQHIVLSNPSGNATVVGNTPGYSQ